jgi:hypothetical protein
VKVTYAVTVELDPEDWTQAFGVTGDREIRQDVREYLHNNVPGIGVFGNGEVPAKFVQTSR